MPTAKPVTAAEIAKAVKALGITIPIRSATRKGSQIILHTRAGDHAWTPPEAKKRTSRARKPATGP